MDETLTLQFDGGSRGNPGPAGVGIVICAADGTSIVTLGRYIGRATNNVAEYTALITAMQEAQKLGANKLLIRGDSELVIKQMRGEYRVKNPGLKALYDRAITLSRQFQAVAFEHNLRHHNTLADELANLAMDRKAEVTDVSASAGAPGSDDHVVAPVAIQRPVPPPSVPGDTFQCTACQCLITIKRPSNLLRDRYKAFVCQCGSKMVLTFL